MLVSASVSGVAHVMKDSSVHIFCFLRPIVLLSKCVVHNSLSGMSGKQRMM